MDPVPAPPETLGQLIKRLRDGKNLSAERLEELVGYSPGSGIVTQIEKGTRGKRLSRDKAAAFAQALGVPVTEILRAAGKLTRTEEDAIAARPSFEDFVGSDQSLRIEQKRMLILLYNSYVPKSRRGSGRT